MMGDPMSRFTNDINGILDLTLSQLGLFLATGILLAAVFSLVFYNDWQRSAELESLASSFTRLLEDVDTMFFENTTRFDFPEKNYDYAVQLSREHIFISAKGYWKSDLVGKERFLIRPWPRSSQQNWTTGADLHEYLNSTYGHRGIQEDALSSVNFTIFCYELNMTIAFFALNPLEIRIHEPVFLEKVKIFYDDDRSLDLLLVYQW
jgi:hypothetical protein